MPGPVIALVGMACRYADARSPDELWQNVLAQRRAFRRMPRERLDAADYLSSDPHDTDSIYTDQAAVLEGWSFDRARFRIAGPTYRQVDPAHWLALEVTAEALADAGFADGEGLPREATGVILGNTLTGEFSRANALRLRWPFVRRVTDAALRERGWDPSQRRAFLGELEGRFKAPFPEVGEESLAGGLSNTIAGRICNYYDLKGGGYTVDGACAASLLAVATACSQIAAGDLDVAIVGGVDLSLDPFELVGFARTGALAPEAMRVYDVRSAGFWPGEGCGILVLMRGEDASARGLRPYALVRGWGVASDGAGGITRPEAEGQLLAVRRACRRAGFDLGTVSYVEGHGTGTQVGDAVELEVLARARREAVSSAMPLALGTIKANLGHTKAAAGAAGLIKAALSLHHQIVPPTTGCFDPHPAVAGESVLRIVREGAPWPADQPLRAGVSAMGFGGIDTHVVLEGVSGARRASLTPEETALLAAPQDVELFLFGASNAEGLRRQVENVLGYAGRLSIAELTDLAAALQPPENSAARAAVVAGTPAELERKLGRITGWLAEDGGPQLDGLDGVFLGHAGRARIGFLFTGQGSPAHLDGGAWRRRFGFARERWSRIAIPSGADGRDTRVAQPAIVTASLVALEALRRAGVEASLGVGHSLGELTALHWAGAFDEEALLRIATARGRAMSEAGSPDGSMASLATDAEAAAAIVAGTGVVLAGLNAPRQTVISGPARAVAEVIERARMRGIAAVRLPVSHAFHSPLVAPAATQLAAHLRSESFQPLARPVLSTITGGVLDADHDLRGLLLTQVLSPVRFAEALAQADSEIDLWIEAGPGAVLCGLATAQCRAPAISVDAGGSSFAGFLGALGAAFVLGAPLLHRALVEGRFVRPFDHLEWRPRFLANPCESAPRLEEAHEARGDDGTAAGNGEPIATAAPARAADAVAPGPRAAETEAAPASPLEVVRDLVAERVELSPDAVKDAHGLLRDLHLSSIVVGQIAAEAAKRLGLPPPADPTAWAGATVAELAEALGELKATGQDQGARGREHTPAGLDLWVRAFELRWVEKLQSIQRTPADPGGWRIFAEPGDVLTLELERRLLPAPGRGVVVCLPAEPSASAAGLLIQAARELWPGRAGASFVVVERDRGGGGAFARTLHLESPETVACVVGVPSGDPRAASWVVAEALGASGYVEACYDRQGVRLEPRLALLDAGGKDSAKTSGALPPLGPDDVLVVTGGGKGIAAECALDLARWTGARLAILGRSRPEEDATLAANLTRMAGAGATCRYFPADVTDESQVRAAVLAAERELGPVTALLHGAGTNDPCPLAALDEAAFHATLAPKVTGLRNLLAALAPGRLKVLVGFGSIISRIGLPGEADYAVANEWLTCLIQRFQRDHPRCRCLSVEWSVWSGAGMGERLGRVDRLARAGVTAITPEIGVRMLRQLLVQATPVAVVVTGRFGAPATLKMDGAETPLYRFLERVRVDVPGVELVADAELSAENDPYLEDHAWKGARLFPAVMGLEAMAQTACAAARAAGTPWFEEVRFDRPVALDGNGRRTIRLAALVREPGRVEVALRCDDTGFLVDHFRAVCRFDLGAAAEGAAATGVSAAAGLGGGFGAPDGGPLALNPERDLYGRVMFQSGRFRRVRGYSHLRATESVAELRPGAQSSWFGAWTPANLILGDPGARDAALHSIQASIPHRTLLPVAVERVEAVTLAGSDSLLAHARERRSDGETYVYDLEIAEPSGTVLERWTGLTLRAVGPTPNLGPWPAALLGAFLERRFLECVPGRGIAAVLKSDRAEATRRRPLGLLRANGDMVVLPGAEVTTGDSAQAVVEAAAGRDLVIARRPDGKPEVVAEPWLRVSTAGAGKVSLALTGSVEVGCDLEPVSPRSPETWQALLGPERASLATVLAHECHEDHDTACTRIWTVIECLKKSGAPAGTPVRMGAACDRGWLVLHAGELRVASFVADLVDGSRVAIGLLAGTCDARV